MRGALLFAAVLLVLGGLGWAILGTRPIGDGTALEDPTGPARARPQGDALRIPVPAPDSLNPFVAAHPVTARYVLPFTHDTLLDRDPRTGAVRAALAESFTTSDDGRTVTFVLRDGLRFADGSEVTPADWQFTFDVARHAKIAPKSDMSLLLASLESATATEDGRVVLRASEPRAGLAEVAGRAVGPVSRGFWIAAVERRAGAEVAAQPGSDEFVAALCNVADGGIGTGPWVLARAADGAPQWDESGLLLVRNPHSWRRAAQPECWNLAGIRLVFALDEAANLARARVGEIDLFYSLIGADLEKLLASDPALAEHFVAHSYDAPHLAHWLVEWNCSKPHLADARVRRALGLLFDRERLITEVVHGQGVVARGWFKPGTPEYPDHLPAPRFDPAEARRRLAEAGFAPGSRPLRIELLAGNTGTNRRIVALARAWFEQAGVELEAQLVDRATLMAREADGTFDGILMVDQHGTNIDPLDVFVTTDRMRWHSAEAERLLRAARIELDAEARRALYHRFQELLREEEPVTLLYHPLAEALLHRRYRDAEPGPLGLDPERWWVPVEEQLVAPW